LCGGNPQSLAEEGFACSAAGVRLRRVDLGMDEVHPRQARFQEGEMKRAAKNRLTAKSGTITLYLNGETFAVPMDETDRLNQLCRNCERLGEDQIAQQLKEGIQELEQPLPRGTQAVAYAALAFNEQISSLLEPIDSGRARAADVKFGLAIKEYIVKKLSRS
jgi:hypothetical protein